MHLSPDVAKRYTKEDISAREAQRQAECIAWAPVVFQVSRLMVKFGILTLLRESEEGLTIEQLQEKTQLSRYALKILLEASLSAGTVLVDLDTERFTLSKTGWFLLTDPATRVNMELNHDVNYRGLFHLEESLLEGKPAGLKTLGDWPTIYEGLSKLQPDVQKSWLDFDHFYSDNSFDEALSFVFAQKTRRLMDIGGNTGKFALRCVEYSPEVEVTIVDLPGQIGMMKENTKGHHGAERIKAFPTDLLKPENRLPKGGWDAVWMSQFLDCFSEEQIYQILCKAREVMSSDTTLFVMETFWDRQRFEPAALALTMTSVYFTAIANGNSKMYHSDDLLRQVERAGLKVTAIHDGIGQGHTILEIKKP